MKYLILLFLISCELAVDTNVIVYLSIPILTARK
jgi:hypothetical protein